MNPVASIFRVFRRSFDFSGRSSRSETWWYVLFVAVLTVGTVWLDRWLGSPITKLGTGAIRLSVAVALFIPTLSVATRRFHDVGLSGYWILLYWLVGVAQRSTLLINRGLGGKPDNALAIGVALVGWAAVALVLVILALPGVRGPNRYGPDPLDRTDFQDVFR